LDLRGEDSHLQSDLWRRGDLLSSGRHGGFLDDFLLTPKFGKESDLWVRFEKESVWWKEGYFQRFSAKRSAVGYLLRFGKGIVELILRDWTVTWLNQGRRMDG
jgi:hypothetical protein